MTKCISSLGKKKLSDKVWELRQKTSGKYSDRQFVSVVNPKTGKLTRNRRETNEVVLDYNHELLRKTKLRDRILRGGICHILR